LAKLEEGQQTGSLEEGQLTGSLPTKGTSNSLHAGTGGAEIRFRQNWSDQSLHSATP
jgi:hypothetical protein